MAWLVVLLLAWSIGRGRVNCFKFHIWEGVKNIPLFIDVGGWIAWLELLIALGHGWLRDYGLEWIQRGGTTEESAGRGTRSFIRRCFFSLLYWIEALLINKFYLFWGASREMIIIDPFLPIAKVGIWLIITSVPVKLNHDPRLVIEEKWLAVVAHLGDWWKRTYIYVCMHPDRNKIRRSSSARKNWLVIHKWYTQKPFIIGLFFEIFH
jgi:hypothetical protein